jgi:SAM-dependent methyltransferase
MPHPSWNESYAVGELPWDTGEPEPLLVEFVTSSRVQPTRTLEVGAGTGTNSLWLAERGFDVLGIDVAPLAVERANAKLEGRRLGCRFATLDFLATSPHGGPFQFIFDRGCFHVFDEPEERARFSAQVVAATRAWRPVAEPHRLDRRSAAGGRPAAPLGSAGDSGYRTCARNCRTA